MATLLNHCTLILGHDGIAETFEWASLSFEKVHQVRSALIDMGYSVNTINLCLAGLRGVTKAAFHLGLVEGDDFIRMGAIPSVKGRTSTRNGRRLSRPEIKQLLKACSQLTSLAKQRRDKAVLLVGVGAGLRCSELCDLNREDIDLTAERLIVQEGKGRKQRILYLARNVLIALRQWIEVRGETDGPLFPRLHRNGNITQQRLTPGGLSHTLKTVQTLAHVEAFTPHDLRRTFITHLLEQGTDLNTVRQLAGHSDVGTTLRYDKRDEQWQKRATQALKF